MLARVFFGDENSRNGSRRNSTDNSGSSSRRRRRNGVIWDAWGNWTAIV